jgi:hypothetical protein
MYAMLINNFKKTMTDRPPLLVLQTTDSALVLSQLSTAGFAFSCITADDRFKLLIPLTSQPIFYRPDEDEDEDEDRRRIFRWPSVHQGEPTLVSTAEAGF